MTKNFEDMENLAEMGKKIVKTVTEGYQKIEDKFTDTFLTEDGDFKVGKVGEAVIEGYKKIEDGVVDGYKKLEEGIVEGFNKVNDKMIEKLFTKENETVEEAKERLSGESKSAEEAEECPGEKE